MYIIHFLWYSDRLTLVVIFIFLKFSGHLRSSSELLFHHWLPHVIGPRVSHPLVFVVSRSVSAVLWIYILRELSNTALAVFYSRVNELKTKTTRLIEDLLDAVYFSCYVYLCHIPRQSVWTPLYTQYPLPIIDNTMHKTLWMQRTKQWTTYST